MLNQAFNILSSIIVLAIVAVVLSRGSNTAGVLTSFGSFFSGSLRAAEGK